MNMIWSIPVGVLLAAALLIGLINRGRPNIGAAWFIAILAALFVWGWTFSLYWRPDVTISPVMTAVPEVSGEIEPLEDEFEAISAPIFVLDRISYPYMLAVSALLLILLLTAPSYMEPQSAPRLWFFYLLIEAIGYLSVSADDITFIIYGWVIFDAVDLAAQYLQIRPGRIRRSFVTAVGIRFIGTFLTAASLALSSAEVPSGTSEFISPGAGAPLLIACALRMGILPISQPYSEMNNSRIGLGTMLRLVSALTVMPILSRIPLSALSPNMTFFLGLAAGVASLTGAVGWLLSESPAAGYSYAALGICGMAYGCALNGERMSLIPWGVSIVLVCGPLSLYQIHNALMNILSGLLVLGFSGLPYMPNAFGWAGLIHQPFDFQSILYTLVVMFLIGGTYIHILRTEGRKFSDLEPWMRSVYPLGFVVAIGNLFFISFTGFEQRFSMGVIPASAAAFGGGVLMAVLARHLPDDLRTQNVIAWGREGISLFWRVMKRVLDMEWLMTLSRFIRDGVRYVVTGISLVLEDHGGLIWELLLLALLVAAAFSGGSL